jgi:hypothetical protein
MSDNLTHPVYYEGVQWAATGFGIEGVGPYSFYNIAGRDLGKPDLGGEPFWPAHMREKNWVNMDDFMNAYRVALRYHEGE